MIETLLEIQLSYTVLSSLAIGLLGVVGGGLAVGAKYFEYKKSTAKKIEEYKEEIKDLSRPMLMDLKLLNDLHSVGEEILNTTKSTRFLILVATNGQQELRKASVIYEQHSFSGVSSVSLGATGRYVEFEFDRPYMDMLKRIELGGSEFFVVDDMEDSDLKSIYTAEGVTQSEVFFLRRTKIDEANDRLWYASVATHEDKILDDTDKIVIKTNISKVRNIFNEMEVMNK